MDSRDFNVSVQGQTLRYAVQFPSHLHESVVWIRSIDRDLRARHMSRSIREDLFVANGWQLTLFQRLIKSGVPLEKQYLSTQRVSCMVTHIPHEEPRHQSGGMITRKEAYKRVRISAKRAVKRFKAMQEESNLAVAPILCYGLLKLKRTYFTNLGDKYTTFV